MMTTIFRRRAVSLAAVLGITACEVALGPDDPRVEDFDFDAGAQGWTAEFADYPVGGEEDYDLTSGVRPLPDPLDAGRTGFLLSGVNHSDDLFMYVQRRIDGLEASTEYRVRFEVEFATNAPSGCSGVGGTPGESVVVKAGASPDEPTREVDADGHYRLTLDKGNQLAEGSEAIILGNVGNSVSTCQTMIYELKTLDSGSRVLTAESDEGGRLWLLVGIDSGFEARTALYLTRIRVELEPR